MLFRKIASRIEEHLQSGSNKIMIVEGARQIGKSYIINHIGSRLFANFVEINLVEDNEGPQHFRDVRTVEDFYLQLSIVANGRLGNYDDTLIFLDEIQEYPHLLTLLKFLKRDNRYRYIASGSLLGVTLRQTTSIPIGTIEIADMYPLDFEEFLIANGYGREVLNYIRGQYEKREALTTAIHNRTLDLFKKYLIVGGMPEAVQSYIEDQNVVKVRQIQSDISRLYKIDASKYDQAHRLNIHRIYDMIPSAMENKKKRIIAKDIEDKVGARFEKYADDFEYLLSSGIALGVKAISNPKFPLLESAAKNLIKLYLNDVGLLTNTLYHNNIHAILDTQQSVNLGSVYESVVAQELKCLGYNLYYYDNKANGEVDFLIDNFSDLSVMPIEVKSGKDYTKHSALSRFVATPDYGIKEAIVFSNEATVKTKGKITYLPVYFVMCLKH